MSSKHLARPANMRELRLYSAGQYKGMANYAMARARHVTGSARKQLVIEARSFFRTYLARLREAQDATFDRPVGYYVPREAGEPLVSVGAVVEQPVRLMKRQAS